MNNGVSTTGGRVDRMFLSDGFTLPGVESELCLRLVFIGNIKLKAKKETDIKLISKVVFEDCDSLEAKRRSGYIFSLTSTL